MSASGVENEAPQVQARVRNHDLMVAQGDVAGVEDVEIDDARRVARAFGRASKRGFDPLQSIEQRDGLAFVFHLDDGIQIGAGIRASVTGSVS